MVIILTSVILASNLLKDLFFVVVIVTVVAVVLFLILFLFDFSGS